MRMRATHPERTWRIGTRGSRLALWQAERVAALLREHHPAVTLEVVPIHSSGDVHQGAISELVPVGMFTREIELALQAGKVDLAVHSLKDLPTTPPEGLVVAAVLPRDDPRDLLVARALAGRVRDDGRAALAALPSGARIATSSLRRRAELLRARSDLQVIELRGNVPTRLEKVERGEVDGVVLSLAGLVRLALTPPGGVPLDPEVMMPAPAQGTIAVQVRSDDRPARTLVEELDDRTTRLCTTAERLLLHELEGGCRIPLGALAHLSGDDVTLHARLLSADGGIVLEEAVTGSADALPGLALRLAESLRARGAARILADLRLSGRST
jgi:hydroxymethylbilane synthase